MPGTAALMWLNPGLRETRRHLPFRRSLRARRSCRDGRRVCRHGRLRKKGMIGDYRAHGIHPGLSARGGLRPCEKARRGRRRNLDGRPVASPRFSRPGLLGRGASSRLDHRSSGPAAGPPLPGQPSGCLSALGARPARSGRGADVFGPSRLSSLRSLAERSPAVEAAARVGRTPSARRGTASPPHRDPVRTRLPRRRGMGTHNHRKGILSRSISRTIPRLAARNDPDAPSPS
jgi:hypothetical protein